MPTDFKTFDNRNTMILAASELLKEHMQIQSNDAHAIMLSGGRTPIPVYQEVTRHPFPVSGNLHIMMSDERMVPESSSDNNFSHMTEMISTLGIGNKRILKVDTSLPLEIAAAQYSSKLSLFFKQNGRLTLALLGIGPDGHTASLFPPEDIEKARGEFAISVSGMPPFDRVSTTPETIIKAEKIVFLVAGREKETVAIKLKNDPGSLIAGQVVKDAANIDIWYTA